MQAGPEGFAAFHKAVHGRPPFAWQSRLFEQVLRAGWPAAISAPTGTGKTAVLDIALYHLALQAGAPDRSAPLRIVFAVDRRVVVDQAFERAKKLRDALSGPDLRELAEALRRFGGETLHVEELRGGMPREDDWALSPAQPTILCTTIDQLGSRLLFRGYGVSPRMAPIHAGLLGEDALLLLDEAHLSGAFHETLEGVARRRRDRSEFGAERPWAVCALTATPRDEAGTFTLTAGERAEPSIAARLSAAKPARLDIVKTSPAPAFAAEARALAARCGRRDPVVAIVVNRVALARQVHGQLVEAGTDAILLTGRVRPVERDELIQVYEKRFAAGEQRRAGDAPLFVVATQCIEAGADFDFDALVSQIAPLDSLRQRFGRLNRIGTRTGLALAAILALPDDVSKRTADPIYGERARLTWDWLLSVASPDKTVDFGVDAMARAVAPDSLQSPFAHAPWLRPADMALFSITNPSPTPDPALPLFLHGDARVSPDVRIVWRADLDAASFATRIGSAAACRIVALVPPRAGEALSVPIWAARAWLAEAPASELADTDMVDTTPDGWANARRVLRWRGPTDAASGLIGAGNIRPGDLLVAPAEYGGCDRFGWAPDDRAPVRDVADSAARPYATRRLVIRLHRALFAPSEWPEGLTEAVADADARAPERTLSRLRDVTGLSEQLSRPLEHASQAERLSIETPYGDAVAEQAPPTGLVIVARFKRVLGLAPDATPVTEDDDASVGEQAQDLQHHTRAVERKARGFASACGLPSRLVESVAMAAHGHDTGKADPRFQRYLHGGTPGETLLAKSDRTWAGPAEVAMRRASRLPEAWRHEVLSVRYAIAALDEDASPIDADLVLWLIGTHHGHGRPAFDHTDEWDSYGHTRDGQHLPVTPGPDHLAFDWRGMDWAELFDVLKARYGIWGLALLEAVLRLADHRASAEAA